MLCWCLPKIACIPACLFHLSPVYLISVMLRMDLWGWTHWQESGRFRWGRSVHLSAKWRAGRRRGRETGSWRWWIGSSEPGPPESTLQGERRQKEESEMSITDPQSSSAKASFIHNTDFNQRMRREELVEKKTNAKVCFDWPGLCWL